MPESMDAAVDTEREDNPALSVVLVTPGGLPPLRHTLLALASQTAAHCLELIIVGPGQPRQNPGLDPGPFEAVHWVPCRTAVRNIHRARARGVFRARSPLVSFAENHAFPRKAWAAALIQARKDGWQAVGPVMVNANPATAVSRAHLLLAHGPWMPPQHSGPRTALPWHNSVYRTADLRRFGPQLPRLLAAEGLLQDNLRRQGARFYQSANAVVDHLNIGCLQPFWAEQFLSGRLYGATRSQGWSIARRVGYILGAGLIPALRLRRMLRARPAIPGDLIPFLLAGIAAHTLGEVYGYGWGAGYAVRRLAVYELERENFIPFRDRKALDARFSTSAPQAKKIPKTNSGERKTGNRPGIFPIHWKERLKKILAHAPVALPPLRLQVDVTDNCNFTCPDCLKWRVRQQRPEMSAAQSRELWRRLKYLILFREVTISGGEPLLREDLSEIVAGAQRAGFHTTVATNGWCLDAARFDQLATAGLQRILLSLNSLDAGTHDRSKNKPGSYERARAAIRHWEQARHHTDLVVGTLITPANVHELAAMVAFVERRNASILFQAYCEPQVHYPFADQRSIPTTFPARNALAWSADALAVLDQAIRRLLQLKARQAPIRNSALQLKRIRAFCHDPLSENGGPCHGTHFRLFIDPAGWVRLCQGTAPVGHILSCNPLQLWWGAAARRIRRSSLTCTNPCRMLNNHW